MPDDLELKHELALERQRNADRLRRERDIDRITRAQIGELDAMKLQHELDKENRGLDHQFNRAEDIRILQHLTSDLAIRRRDDFTRKLWEDEQNADALEGEILKKIADHKIAKSQESQRHRHDMEAKYADHINNIEYKTHETNEAIREFEEKERLKIVISREMGIVTDEEVAASMERVRKKLSENLR